MTQHTPGPWSVYEHEGGYTIQNPLIDSESGVPMYDPIIWEMGGIDTEANAHLIAAAPELLAALQKARIYVDRMTIQVGGGRGDEWKSRALLAEIDTAIAHACPPESEPPVV